MQFLRRLCWDFSAFRLTEWWFIPWFEICFVHVFCKCIVSICCIKCGWIWWTNIVRIIRAAFKIIFVIWIIPRIFIMCTIWIVTVDIFVVICWIQWWISEIIWIWLPTLEVFIIIWNSIDNVTSAFIVIKLVQIWAHAVWRRRCSSWWCGRCFNFPISIWIGDIFILAMLQLWFTFVLIH